MPEGATVEELLDINASRNAERYMAEGYSSAFRSVELADLSAREICAFFIRNENEVADYIRIGASKSEFIVLEVFNANANDATLSNQFFNSMRKNSTN